MELKIATAGTEEEREHLRAQVKQVSNASVTDAFSMYSAKQGAMNAQMQMMAAPRMMMMPARMPMMMMGGTPGQMVNQYATMGRQLGGFANMPMMGMGMQQMGMQAMGGMMPMGQMPMMMQRPVQMVQQPMQMRANMVMPAMP
jgi:hypothetical protein